MAKMSWTMTKRMKKSPTPIATPNPSPVGDEKAVSPSPGPRGNSSGGGSLSSLSCPVFTVRIYYLVAERFFPRRLPFLSLVLVASLLFTPPALSQGKEIRFVGTDGLRLRAGPSTEEEVLGFLATNEQVRLIEKRGKWALVSVPALGRTGWIYAPYLRLQPKPTRTGPYAYPAARVGAERLNLRAFPGLDARVMARLWRGTKVYVVTRAGEWVFVSVPALKARGWVFADYLDWMPWAEVVGSDVRMRSGPGTAYPVVARLSGPGRRFVIRQTRGKWYQLADPAGSLRGWVFGELVRVEGVDELAAKLPASTDNKRAGPAAGSLIRLSSGQDAVTPAEERWAKLLLGTSYRAEPGLAVELDDGQGAKGSASEIGVRLVREARRYLGTPYRWGGDGPGGFDCSGFIVYLLSRLGYPIPDRARTASQLFARVGRSVSYGELRPGDLVFFTTYRPGASHVGIYLGGGKFIHASSARSRVTINDLSKGYYRRRFVGARRP